MANRKYISGVSQYVIGVADRYLDVDCSAGPVALYLPNIRNNWGDLSGKDIFITDSSNFSATNNITIYGSKNTVNFLTSVVMNKNGMKAKCSVGSLQDWQAQLQYINGVPAQQTAYDNSDGNLQATNAQEAIAELAETKIYTSVSAPLNPHENQFWVPIT